MDNDSSPHKPQTQSPHFPLEKLMGYVIGQPFFAFLGINCFFTVNSLQIYKNIVYYD
jgi:hypothetical protein